MPVCHSLTGPFFASGPPARLAWMEAAAAFGEQIRFIALHPPPLGLTPIAHGVDKTKRSPQGGRALLLVV